MRLATCFSGIGAPEAAMPEAEHIWCAEIEPAPSAVLAHRVGSPNLGDVLAADFIDRANTYGPIDVLVGGPPCQAFSIAGLRLSMQDARGNLTLRWAQIIHGTKPRSAVTENVPGWLSTRDNAFGCFLAGLVGADAPLLPPDRQWGAMPHFHRGSYNVERTYGWKHIRWPGEGMVEGPRARATWRILNAEYFGLAQRRNRVFVVADFGDGADPAAVLFERKGVRGDSAPRGQAGKVAPTIPSRSTAGGGLGTDFDCDGGLIEQQWPAEIAPTMNAHFGDKRGLEDQHINGGGGISSPHLSMCLNAHPNRLDAESETLIPVNRCGFDVTHALTGEGFDASEDGTGRGTPIIPVHSFDARQSDVIQYGPLAGPLAGPLDTDGHSQAVFSIMPMNSGKDFVARETDVAQPLMAGGPVGGNQGGDYICFTAKDYGADAGDISPALRTGGHTGSHANAGVMPAVAFDLRGREGGSQFEGPHDTASIRAASGGSSRSYIASIGVRRLMPRECLKLQGFSPDYFDGVKYCGKPLADGPMYKMTGNSQAVPVVRWILKRIEALL